MAVSLISCKRGVLYSISISLYFKELIYEQEHVLCDSNENSVALGI